MKLGGGTQKGPLDMEKEAKGSISSADLGGISNVDNLIVISYKGRFFFIMHLK